MAISVVMPALEMAQETGKLVSWRKQEGEKVAKGEPLLEVETDKAVMEIEAPADGILAGVKVSAGAVVPVGQVIAWLVAAGEAPPQDAGPVASARKMSAETVAVGAAAAAAPAPEPVAASGPVRMSPKARRLAKEHGVDCRKVRGSGPTGEILAADMQAYIEGSQSAPVVAAASSAAAAAPVPARTATTAPVSPIAVGSAVAVIEPPTAVGRLMAERTTASWTTVPHIFFTREIDATALNAARQKHLAPIEQAKGVRPTHTDLLVSIVSRVIMMHPRINASFDNGSIRPNPEVNMGIAMAVKDGVVAAVIPSAQTAALGDISVQRKQLTDRARAGRLRPADIANGTFTISNLGMFDIDNFTAIITPPQSAILAVSRIVDKVVPVCGNIGIRPMLTLTLSVDHRVSSGAHAAAFLKDLADALITPEAWLD